MVSSSKILTVSYGTFSCTLEGFDDSFDTMKAIAEYFRDLAQDDRYFGAEPPTPDAEMLARIAEREIARRVEARIQDGSVVLRPSLGHAAAQEAAAQQKQDPAAATPPQTEASATSSDAPPRNQPEAPAPTPAVSQGVDDGVAAKLQRIRSVVTAGAPPVAGATQDYEDEQETGASDPSADMSLADAFADADREESPKGDAARDKVPATGPDSNTIDAGDTETDPAIAALFGDHASEDADTHEEAPEAWAEHEVAEHSEETVAHEDGSDLVETDPDLASVSALFDAPGSEDDEAPMTLTPEMAVPPEESAQQARVAKVRKSDFEAAVASGALEPVDAAAESSSLSDEEEADLARELAELEAELAGTTTDPSDFGLEEEDDDDDDDEVTAVAPDLAEERETLVEDVDAEEPAEARFEDEVADDSVAGEPAEEDRPRIGLAATDEAEDEDEARDEFSRELAAAFAAGDAEVEAAFDADDESEEDEPPCAAATDEDDETDDAESEFDMDGGALEHARRAVKMSSPARALLTEGRIEEDETSVSRLMEETDKEFEEPEGSRRRSAIAHLRAAVAATRADRLLGRRKPPEDEAEPYREDLATVVRPRRPQSGGGTPRPAADRPAPVKQAPLKLVAEQRVDPGADLQQPEAAEAVRPRRIRRDALAARDPAPAAPEQSFSDFAREMGAVELPELLEAAAAYMSFVEARPQFSRPQLMTKLREAEEAESSREDRLRSFGQLLRAGKIAKIEGGRYTASDRIGFRPEDRAAG